MSHICGLEGIQLTFINECYSRESILLFTCIKRGGEISGYVTCVYDHQWWVSYTLETQSDIEEVTLSFLHPHWPSRFFQYPSRPDVFRVSCSDILTKANQTPATGRVYKLSRDDSKNAP